MLRNAAVLVTGRHLVRDTELSTKGPQGCCCTTPTPAHPSADVHSGSGPPKSAASPTLDSLAQPSLPSRIFCGRGRHKLSVLHFGCAALPPSAEASQARRTVHCTALCTAPCWRCRGGRCYEHAGGAAPSQRPGLCPSLAYTTAAHSPQSHAALHRGRLPAGITQGRHARNPTVPLVMRQSAASQHMPS